MTNQQPNRQQLLEALRGKIVEASSDLMFDFEHKDILRYSGENEQGVNIWKPTDIRLADVLLSVQNREMWVSVTEAGNIGRSGIGGAFVDRNWAKWDLRQDSLDLQSIETLQSLHDLLK